MWGVMCVMHDAVQDVWCVVFALCDGKCLIYEIL